MPAGCSRLARFLSARDDATALWLDLAGAAAIKVTVLVAAAALVAFALRRASASARHAVWGATLFGALALPALTLVLPTWRTPAVIPMLVTGERVNGAFISPGAVAITRALDPVEHANALPHAEGIASLSDEPASPSANALRDLRHADDALQPGAQDNTNGNGVLRTLAKAWMLGALLCVFAVFTSRDSVRRLALGSRTVTDSRLQHMASRIASELRIGRSVRLLQSDHAAMPATWGILHPVILLPADATEWPADRANVVLLHELTHVKRWDCLSQFVAQLACALLWFHPAVWYAAARLRVERELACDEQVIAAGTDACDYAAHLVDVARSFRASTLTSWTAVGMARPSNFEDRVRTILRARHGSSMSTVVARTAITCSIGLFVMVLSAMRPAAAPSASLNPLPSASDTLAPMSPRSSAIAPMRSSVYAESSDSSASASAGAYVDSTATGSASASPSASRIAAAVGVGADGSGSGVGDGDGSGAGSGVGANGYESSAKSLSRNGMSAETDTLRWSGRIEPGRWIEVYNAIGDIRAELSNGSETELLVIGGDGALGSRVSVVPKRSRDGIRFCPVYSDGAGRWDMCDPPGRDGYLGNTSLTIVVRVPRGVGLAAHAMKGDVDAKGLASYVWGTSINGDVRISTSDVAEASTFHGSITATFNRARWTENLEFLTENGDVTVTAPTNASAFIELVGSRGQIASDWNLKRGAMGRDAERAAGATSPDSTPRVRQMRGALTLHTGKGKATLLRGSSGDATAEPAYASAPSSAPRNERDPKPNPNPVAGENSNPNPPNSRNDGDPTGERFTFTASDRTVERISAASLRGARDSAVISRLRALATQPPKHEADLVAVRAQWALTLVRDGRITEGLTQSLTDKDWRVRAFAAWAIGAGGARTDVQQLTRALEDENWRVRMHAAYALEQRADPASFDALLEALTDQEWQVRIGAVQALGALGDGRAVAALQRLSSSDRTSIVREGADEAILKLIRR